ncbi:MAG: divergent polysaccharide deacetylase family protein [Spirochaetes bacterium]|nr:divergent polysaccharide deacetylase family protein [Spirochaetota bacterium]
MDAAIKRRLRIKLLTLGLLFLTAFFIGLLIYLPSASASAGSYANADLAPEDRMMALREDEPLPEAMFGYEDMQKTAGASSKDNDIRETAKENISIAASKKDRTNIAARPARTKTLYFIIDDAGHSMEQLQPFLDFPGALTIAVLPGLVNSRRSAELALKSGKKVILHQPMESIRGIDPGPYSINLGMEEEEIIGILERNINSIPGVIGVNNHMGSAVTADKRIMRIILEYLHNKGLLFLDSLTTHNSICRKVAADLGFVILQRDVFLDHINERKAILNAINTGKTIARNRGYAVMIGHVWSSELAKIMTQIYPNLIEEGFILRDIGSFPIGEGYFAGTGN